MDRLLRRNPEHRYANELHIFIKDAQGACVRGSISVDWPGWLRIGSFLLTRAPLSRTLLRGTQPNRTWPSAWAWAWAWWAPRPPSSWERF